MDNTSKAMVSRSLRLHKSTLTVLEKEAKNKGLGITVYIRKILEGAADILEHQNDDLIHFPEL